MNNVQLLGRLANDPIIINKDNKVIARYILAINEFNNVTNFIPCSAYGNVAVIAEKFLKKGMLIAIAGKLHTYKENDENDTVLKMNVVVIRQFFCEKTNTNTNNNNNIKYDENGYIDFSDIDESTLPFQ